MNKDMLDISIREMKKVIDSESKAQLLFDTPILVEEKYDGTKLTLVRNKEPYSQDYTKNWIVAYKGNIIYPTEFSGVDRKTIEKDSVGVSQYALVHEALKKVNPRLKNIPPSTEFLVEFNQKKSTLTRNYKTSHKMILLAYSPTTVISARNRLRTTPEGFMVSKLGEYATALGMALPSRLFTGKLIDLPDGLSDRVKKVFVKYQARFETETTFVRKEEIVRKIFTEFESSLGGKPEGSVVKYMDGKIIGKYVNSDQYSSVEGSDRFNNRNRWRMGYEEEKRYFAEIEKLANETVKNLQKTGVLQKDLESLSSTVYTMDLSFIVHDKKDNFKKQDDLYFVCKKILVKNQKGNNWCLFQGRFQPPTKAHIDIIKKYSRLYDGVQVIIVNSKTDPITSPFSDKIRLDILRKGLVGYEGKYKVKFVTSGLIPNTVNSLDDNINAIIGGTDRKKEYQKFADQMGVKFIEVSRGDKDISATKVRDSLLVDDKDAFKANMGFFDPKLFNRMKLEMASVATKEPIQDIKTESVRSELCDMTFEDYVGY